jgi:hypothetical protein
MPEDKLIEVFLNPLQFLEIDEPWASLQKEEPSLEAVLDFICIPGIGSDLKSLIKRYREISVEKTRLFAAPHEQRILDKLVWPLRNAKAAYMCGNYLGTIALCGMVAEMVAMLLSEITQFRLNNRPMSEKDQVSVFGRKFEKLGQDRRVNILAAYAVIDKNLEDAFERIRTTRNRYLHLWSQDHEQLPLDAIKSFEAAVLLVVSAIGQNIKDGKLVMNPALVSYLEQKGTYRGEEDA